MDKVIFRPVRRLQSNTHEPLSCLFIPLSATYPGKACKDVVYSGVKSSHDLLVENIHVHACASRDQFPIVSKKMLDSRGDGIQEVTLYLL